MFCSFAPKFFHNHHKCRTWGRPIAAVQLNRSDWQPWIDNAHRFLCHNLLGGWDRSERYHLDSNPWHHEQVHFDARVEGCGRLNHSTSLLERLEYPAPKWIHFLGISQVESTKSHRKSAKELHSGSTDLRSSQSTRFGTLLRFQRRTLGGPKSSTCRNSSRHRTLIYCHWIQKSDRDWICRGI